MATQESTTLNGIDLDLLRGYIEGMSRSGSNETTARLRHRWTGAFSVEGSAEELEERGHVELRAKHTFRTDWPEPFSGDTGPTPGLEQVLAAVGACAATTCAAKAALGGIALEALEVTTEGKVDLRGVFEVGDESVHPGLSDIRITLHIRSPADDRTLEELRAIVEATSPSLNTLAPSARPRLSVQRMA
jgi:uncharacterized OsmC-like protein